MKRVGHLTLFVCFLALIFCSCSTKKAERGLPEELTPDDSIKLGLIGNAPYIDYTQFDSVKRNIAYADTTNLYQRLDIIYPWNGKAPYKFLMTFHGGDWAGGSKQGRQVLAMQYAATQGYALVNVDYRLCAEAKWPAFLYDAKAAVRFIRANAAKYNLDATNIVVIGEPLTEA